MQDSIVNWGQLLIASRGSLKPEKCFYHLILFKWKNYGSWYYEHYKDDEAFDMAVPMADVWMAYIKHALVDTVKETLGV